MQGGRLHVPPAVREEDLTAADAARSQVMLSPSCGAVQVRRVVWRS